MTRTIKILLLSWLAVFLQSSLSSLFSVWGMVPDLLSIVIASAALIGTANSGIAAGLLAGFLADCYQPATMGLFTFSGVVSGYIAGSIRERVYREQAATQALVAGMLALVRHLFDFWGHGGAGLSQYLRSLLRYGLGSSVYTALVFLLLAASLRKMLKTGSKTGVKSY
jgi:rod shape-determining protein MreD